MERRSSGSGRTVAGKTAVSYLIPVHFGSQVLRGRHQVHSRVKGCLPCIRESMVWHGYMTCDPGLFLKSERPVRYKGAGYMGFECHQCGECCSHLGLVHSIHKDLGNFHFIVYNLYTSDETEVTVDADKHELFLDKSIFAKLPEACPFFRHMPGSEKAYCTVHLTRPDICQDFSCWRLLILNHTGRRVGRVMFRRSLVTEDAFLTRIWEECIDPLPETDDTLWDKEVVRILTRAGYSVRQ